jgi:hypothetical protein
MYLLTHDLIPSVADGEKDVAGGLQYFHAAPFARVRNASVPGLFHADLRDLQLVDVRTRIVLGVRNGRLEDFADDHSALLRLNCRMLSAFSTDLPRI